MDFLNQILPAIAVAIVNDNGEVLLQRRRDVNKWCIISGHVEFGETVEQAVLREIEEETNLKAEIVRFIGVYSSPDFQTYRYNNITVQYVTSYFKARVRGDISPGFSNSETQELQFFHQDRLPIDIAMINPYWLTDALNSDNRVFLR